eukprot:scaffold1308_cov247-Pinguiococcus_pyrenoidosus.AAC.4
MFDARLSVANAVCRVDFCHTKGEASARTERAVVSLAWLLPHEAVSTMSRTMSSPSDYAHTLRRAASQLLSADLSGSMRDTLTDRILQSYGPADPLISKACFDGIKACLAAHRRAEAAFAHMSDSAYKVHATPTLATPTRHREAKTKLGLGVGQLPRWIQLATVVSCSFDLPKKGLLIGVVAQRREQGKLLLRVLISKHFTTVEEGDCMFVYVVRDRGERSHFRLKGRLADSTQYRLPGGNHELLQNLVKLHVDTKRLFFPVVKLLEGVSRLLLVVPFHMALIRTVHDRNGDHVTEVPTKSMSQEDEARVKSL